MRKIETEIVTLLEDYEVYGAIAPASASTPYIVYHLIGEDPNQVIGNAANGLVRETYQLDCFGASYKEARELANAIKVIMETWTDAVVYSSAPRSDVESGVFRISRDYDVTYADDLINHAVITNTVLPIVNGGTGQTTASGAINALLPSQTGNSGKFLTTNGTVASWGDALPSGLSIEEPTDLTGQAANEAVYSDSLTVTGTVDRLYPITVRNGYFKASTGLAYQTDGFVKHADVITLKAITASTPSTATLVDLYSDGGYDLQWSVTTADYPTVSSSRLWLNRYSGLYTDVEGTIAATVNDSIASWRAVGGNWGTDLLTQTTSGYRPILKSDGIQADGSDDRLSFPSTLTLTGDFTIYVTMIKTDDSGSSHYLGDGTGNNYLGWSGNFAYGFCNSTHSVDSLDSGTSWALSIRRIRRSGSTWYYKRSGNSEQSKAGSSANFPITTLLRSTITLPSNRRFNQLVIVNKNITPNDADDLAIIAKLQALESGALAP